MRILETEGIAEVLDPATGKPTRAGELGELVMTNLGRWGQPVLRYRTGDLVRARIDSDAAGPADWSWRAGSWDGPTICSLFEGTTSSRAALKP